MEMFTPYLIGFLAIEVLIKMKDQIVFPETNSFTAHKNVQEDIKTDLDLISYKTNPLRRVYEAKQKKETEGKMEQHVGTAGEKVRDLSIYVRYNFDSSTLAVALHGEFTTKRYVSSRTARRQILLRYCDGGVSPREKSRASCEKTEADSMAFLHRLAELSANVYEELWDSGCEEMKSGSQETPSP
ncbi:hypothetical protein KIN20_011239 [Parelaphostrongylus tenuis]|uniref:Uncharacterized protein n=1 Tax=Parelaphostrongylus tenuis TaxID=148309 RepID=A0AAD5MRT5_PARTN|nr:hypothetical protein KIN20_011239 [Parelaphostrongylus tenuis]